MTDDRDRRAFLRGTAASIAVAAVAGCLNDGGDGGGEETDEMDDAGMNDGTTETDAMSGDTDDGMSETDSMADGMDETDDMGGDGMDETDGGMDDGTGEETDSMDDGMDETDDGMTSVHTFEVTVTNVSEPGTLTTSEGDDLAVPLSPTAYAVHTDDVTAFAAGGGASDGLESLAEDGSPDAFASEVEMADGVDTAGAVATPDGGSEAAPLTPGESYSFEVEAGHDHSLTLATMFVQSNDLFYAPEPSGVSLYEDGEPVDGDVTDELVLWDAGTEENQEPGVGADQAPRQDGPDTGPEEMATIRRINDVDDMHSYPDTADVIEVTVTSM
ncbi:spondin domain-containing protein [Halosimplex salinum]|uniref:spondin domain-containing protein n=1 Tax=Halosimplex salinum TaxID=1710538 RepID=UPI000F4A7C8E|nr:spondin domain-containing protein [Halosimplex salinum]